MSAVLKLKQTDNVHVTCYMLRARTCWLFCGVSPGDVLDICPPHDAGVSGRELADRQTDKGVDGQAGSLLVMGGGGGGIDEVEIIYV